MAATNSCARCAAPVEADDYRCVLCGLSVPFDRATTALRARAQVLRCRTCGAALAYTAESRAPRCVYCHDAMELQEPTDPIEQAEHYLPFGVSPQDATAALGRWLGSLGFFRPSDLAPRSTLDGLQAVWWPALVVEARALVSWTADSDAGSGRSQWAPHAGQTPMDFGGLLISASRGLPYEETARLTAHYNLASALSAADGMSGAAVEPFELQRSAARRLVLQSIEATAASRVTNGHVPGSSFRNVHVAVLLHGLTTRRVALPAYVMAYRYNGKAYRAIVHGQSVACTFGDAPYSVWKILGVALGVIALVAIIVAIVAFASQ